MCNEKINNSLYAAFCNRLHKVCFERVACSYKRAIRDKATRHSGNERFDYTSDRKGSFCMIFFMVLMAADSRLRATW